MAKHLVYYDDRLGKLIRRSAPGHYDEVVTKSDIPDISTAQATLDLVKALSNALRAHIVGDYLDGAAGLAEGSTAQNVAYDAVDYHINGEEYQLAANAVGVALAGDDIPQAKYGAFALDIDADGTPDLIAAGDNATGYDSAAEALAGLAAPAADHVRLGTVSLVKSDGAFDPGTTGLDDAATTVVYTDGTIGSTIPAAVS